MARTHIVFALSLFCVLSACTKDVSVKLNQESGTIGSSTVVLTVLGVAQDAGYPQAGCYQAHCLPAWRDKSLRKMATSLALIDAANNNTYLFEATPNLPQQLFNLEQLAPSTRFTLDGVFLTHAHIGHYAGLMFFGHEAMGANQVPVYVMPRMKGFLEENGPWSQLVDFGNIQLRSLQENKPVEFDQIKVTPFSVPHRDEFSETVGYRIEGPNKSAAFIPDIDKWAKWSTPLEQLVASVDYAFLDATFFAQGELPGRDMSKIPHPLVSDTMDRLEGLSPELKRRVWFIHFNHTNPLIDSTSEQAQEVRARGFNVATEGLRLPL